MDRPLFDPPRFGVDIRTAWSKVCEACGTRIYFVTNPATKRNVPVEADGVSHYARCSHPERFSKGRKK